MNRMMLLILVASELIAICLPIVAYYIPGNEGHHQAHNSFPSPHANQFNDGRMNQHHDNFGAGPVVSAYAIAKSPLAASLGTVDFVLFNAGLKNEVDGTVGPVRTIYTDVPIYHRDIAEKHGHEIIDSIHSGTGFGMPVPTNQAPEVFRPPIRYNNNMEMKPVYRQTESIPRNIHPMRPMFNPAAVENPQFIQNFIPSPPMNLARYPYDIPNRTPHGFMGNFGGGGGGPTFYPGAFAPRPNNNYFTFRSRPTYAGTLPRPNNYIGYQPSSKPMDMYGQENADFKKKCKDDIDENDDEIPELDNESTIEEGSKFRYRDLTEEAEADAEGEKIAANLVRSAQKMMGQRLLRNMIQNVSRMIVKEVSKEVANNVPGKDDDDENDEMESQRPADKTLPAKSMKLATTSLEKKPTKSLKTMSTNLQPPMQTSLPATSKAVSKLEPTAIHQQPPKTTLGASLKTTKK